MASSINEQSFINAALCSPDVPGRPRTASDDDILDATARAIGRHGPRDLTLAHIAAEAGLSPATLVQRFGSKRGLLLALADRGPGAAAALFDQVREAEPSPLAALRETLRRLVEGVADRAVLAHNVALLALDLADPDMGAKAADHARVMRAEVGRFLSDALGSGELRPGTDVDRLTSTVLTTYNGALITWALDGDGELADWLVDHLDAVLDPHRSS
jgi:AcrR family transcriptional regulator